MFGKIRKECERKRFDTYFPDRTPDTQIKGFDRHGNTVVYRYRKNDVLDEHHDNVESNFLLKPKSEVLKDGKPTKLPKHFGEQDGRILLVRTKLEEDEGDYE